MGTAIVKARSRVAESQLVTHRKAQRSGSGQSSGAGAVQFLVQGPAARSASKHFTPARLVGMLESGLPFGELEVLQASLSIPAEKLAPMLGISKATLHRCKGAAGTLSPAVSDRVLRYARILGQAREVLEGMEAAKQWLKSPQHGLGGAVPLEYAKSEVGAREVENLLGRIEYGVYS